jgi:hypothetical protein
VTAAIAVPNASHVIFWHGLAWALTSASSGSGTIVAIDPRSNRVIGHAVPFRSAPTAIAAGSTGLWVLAFARQQLVHLILDSGPR